MFAENRLAVGIFEVKGVALAAGRMIVIHQHAGLVIGQPLHKAGNDRACRIGGNVTGATETFEIPHFDRSLQGLANCWIDIDLGKSQPDAIHVIARRGELHDLVEQLRL